MIISPHLAGHKVVQLFAAAAKRDVRIGPAPLTGLAALGPFPARPGPRSGGRGGRHPGTPVPRHRDRVPTRERVPPAQGEHHRSGPGVAGQGSRLRTDSSRQAAPETRKRRNISISSRSLTASAGGVQHLLHRSSSNEQLCNCTTGPHRKAARMRCTRAKVTGSRTANTSGSDD
jgi:hypothetical protein